MKWFKKAKEEKWFPYTVAVCSGVILAFALYNLPIIGNLLAGFWHVVKPVILGVIFAYMLDPIARFIEYRVLGKIRKREIARHIAVGLTIIIALVTCALLVFAFVPPLYNSVINIVNTLSGSTELLHRLFTINSVEVFGKTFSFDIVNDMAAPLWNKIADSGISIEGILATSFDVGNNMFSIVIGFILSIYFLVDKARVKDFAKNIIHYMLSDAKYDRFMEFCAKSDRILLKYMACDLLEGLFVGLGNAVFMAIVGMPYISLISVIVGVTNLAPTFGPIVGGALGALFLLIVNPWYALWFLIFTVILQTIDGYVLKPRLFAGSLGISPLLILVTIVIGGRLFGALGILLAIPAASIAYCFVKDYMPKKHRDSEDAK